MLVQAHGQRPAAARRAAGLVQLVRQPCTSPPMCTHQHASRASVQKSSLRHESHASVQRLSCVKLM